MQGKIALFPVQHTIISSTLVNNGQFCIAFRMNRNFHYYSFSLSTLLLDFINLNLLVLGSAVTSALNNTHFNRLEESPRKKCLRNAGHDTRTREDQSARVNSGGHTGARDIATHMPRTS